MSGALVKQAQQSTEVMLNSADHSVLIAESDAAMEKCEHAMKIWTHSRSGVMLRNMTIGSHPTPMRQLRQVAAELQKKKQAMTEAKYSVLKKRKEAEIKREAAAEEKLTKLQREYLLLEADELEATASMVEQPYLGAMREVIELSRVHDAIEQIVRKKYGKFDESIFEEEEAKYWVQRAFAQSLRDIRQSGVISTGDQELLEQIGLNPVVVRKLLLAFLADTDKNDNLSNKVVDDFLVNCAESYHAASVERIKRYGFPEVSASVSLLLEKDEEVK